MTTPSSAERFYHAGETAVSGFLHHAESARGTLVLTHGAGGNCNTPLLIALGEALALSGVNVLRCDLPFRQAKPTGPPSPSNAKRDQEGLRTVVALMRDRFAGAVYLGGQSYGGRQASMLAASEPSLVNGLLLLSYPLHPPGRPGQLRTAHFPNLHVPVLFVHGSTDPFASADELQSAVRLIPAPTKVVEVAAAGHSLLTKHNRAELPGMVVESFRQWFMNSTREVA